MSLPLPLASNVALYAFETSDFVGRGIVVLLFLISIYAWILMLEKWIVVRRARAEVDAFLDKYHAARGPLELLHQDDKLAGPPAESYRAAMNSLIELLELDSRTLDLCCRERRLPRSLSEVELDKIRNAMERTNGRINADLEHRLPVLGTTISVSPMLGLLGTVWGIMVAFCALAEKGKPDIAALAPGVSGALLTTVAGLVVAIPAAIGYNSLVTKMHRVTSDLDDFTDELLFSLRFLPGR
ncbi:MAG: MotA/TolQ/ExbB proton channel family protein [Lentisphaeria bacterium]|jgi:biopolymer transport protein ExbB/TolQ